MGFSSGRLSSFLVPVGCSGAWPAGCAGCCLELLDLLGLLELLPEMEGGEEAADGALLLLLLLPLPAVCRPGRGESCRFRHHQPWAAD